MYERMLFDHNGAILWKISKTFYKEGQDNIIYRFCMRNPRYDAYFWTILNFWAHFSTKIGVATTPGASNVGLQDGPFEITLLSLDHDFEVDLMVQS